MKEKSLRDGEEEILRGGKDVLREEKGKERDSMKEWRACTTGLDSEQSLWLSRSQVRWSVVPVCSVMREGVCVCEREKEKMKGNLCGIGGAVCVRKQSGKEYDVDWVEHR